MPDNVSRFTVALYDQNEDEVTADWGGDELFTRMPRPPKPDTAPAPRFRPALALVEPPAERRRFAREEDGNRLAPTAVRSEATPPSAFDAAPDDRPDFPGLTLVDPPGSPAGGRRTQVITGRPDAAVRLARTEADRRRPARTPADRIGPRPERIVAWAFALGLILILIAISTADAAML